MNRHQAADLYHQELQALTRFRGELAEVEKAELEARLNGYADSSGSVTDRRYSSDLNSLDLTKDKIDLKTNIEICLDNIFFYKTIISHNVEVPGV